MSTFQTPGKCGSGASGPVPQIIKGTGSLAAGTKICAGEHEEITVTVTGITTACAATVSLVGQPSIAGLEYSVAITAADTAVITVYNNSTSGVACLDQDANFVVQSTIMGP